MKRTTRDWGRGSKEDQGLRYRNKFKIPIRYLSRGVKKATFESGELRRALNSGYKCKSCQPTDGV